MHKVWGLNFRRDKGGEQIMCLQHNPEIPDTGVHLKVDEAVEGRTRKREAGGWRTIINHL